MRICEKILHGKTEEQFLPLFPRYIFIQLEEGVSNWSKIRSTRGVFNLVTFGGIAARAPDFLILRLKEREQMREEAFTKGDHLRIVSGAFSGTEAIFERIFDEEKGIARVLVLLEILSTPQRLIFPAEAVQKLA